MLLVDEYDVPLAKAAKNGYFKPMQEIIRSFLGQVLKPRDLSNSVKPCLFKAVLTGCLSIGKESLFPELNSLEINAVCSMDDSLAEAMGFTAPEVEALLTHCGLQSRFDDVKQWYDGYRFAGREIYCPWDVVNFCQQARKADSPEKYEPENFWSSTSENAEVYEFLGFLSGDDTARMQQLLDGKIVEIRVNEKLSYGDLANHRPDDFWTILLMAGYLTVEEKLNGDCWRVRIPNREIRETFEQKVRQYFSSDGERFSEHAIAFVKAAYAGDADAMMDALSKALDGFVSVRDAAKSPAENYYHGFMNALFSNVRPLVKNYRTNGEAGAGLADIAFTSGLGSKSLGVVIEIKHRKKSEELFSAAEAALRQIEEKHCAKFFDQFRCGGRFVYGIGFSGKDCVVLGGARTDAAKASAGA